MTKYIFPYIGKVNFGLFIYKEAVRVVDISNAEWMCRGTCYTGLSGIYIKIKRFIIYEEIIGKD